MTRRWNALPIRDRVTLWYATSVTALLVVAALLFRAAFTHALWREFDRSLEASASLARGFYESEVLEYGSAEPTLFHIVSKLASADRQVLFVRPDGSLLASPSSSRLPALLEPRQHDEPLDAARAPGWKVRVIASTAPLARPVRRVTELLLLGIPLAVALAGSLGWWLAGRMLRPVADMALATEHIVAGSGARLPLRNPEDELGRLGTRFNALLGRVDASLAQQRLFLADAAHELRTPVSRIASVVELALLDQEPGPSHVAALRHAQADLLRTARLVDQLMQLARLDTTARATHDANRPAFVRVFLDDLACDACIPWRGPAAQAGVSLIQSVIEEAVIIADPVLVDRLIGVLVDNAVRYTPRGGTVDVRVSHEQGAATLVVADTGIGISDDERQHVTARFYRGMAARARQPDGSGLGLAIARLIVDAHGGTLELAAAPGGGTSARVTFPTVD